jgi:hypothetical protein
MLILDTSMPLWVVYCTADSNMRATEWYNGIMESAETCPTSSDH